MRHISFSGGELSRTLRSKRVIGGAAAVAAAGACALAHRYHRAQRQGDSQYIFKPRLHTTVVEALAGALGEVAQIAILYPLDTIKVRCQSASMTAAEVMAELLMAGGFNLDLVRTLYAGVLGATVCSVLVGAVHYASYEACRRHMRQITTIPTPRPLPDSGSSSSSTSCGPASSSPSVSGLAAGTGGLHITAEGQCAEMYRSTDGAVSAGASTSGRPGEGCDSRVSTHHLAGGTRDAGARGTGSGAIDDAEEFILRAAQSHHHVDQLTASVLDPGCPNKTLANVCASVFAALVTALVESPIELFRHNQQAGMVKGNFLREMVSTLRVQGPAGLYWGFLPHCFEAWPHDVTELLVYGRMKDFQEDNATPSGRHYGFVSSLPQTALDFARYGAAGASAVLVSMPFDAVKTYMQTHGTDLTGKGFLGSARLFLSTGQRMVARKGLGCLYFGVVPRLLQQVPSAMVCWSATETVVRVLAPYTMAC